MLHSYHQFHRPAASRLLQWQGQQERRVVISSIILLLSCKLDVTQQSEQQPVHMTRSCEHTGRFHCIDSGRCYLRTSAVAYDSLYIVNHTQPTAVLQYSTHANIYCIYRGKYIYLLCVQYNQNKGAHKPHNTYYMATQELLVDWEIHRDGI